MKGSSAAWVSVYVFGSVVVLELWMAAGFVLPVGQIGSLLIDCHRPFSLAEIWVHRLKD